VLEDLHWADEMSLRRLAFVGRRISAWPVLLVVTARDEDLADATAARRTLDELSRGASTGPCGADAGLVRAISR
jgi:predicted ATPase